MVTLLHTKKMLPITGPQTSAYPLGQRSNIEFKTRGSNEIVYCCSSSPNSNDNKHFHIFQLKLYQSQLSHSLKLSAAGLVGAPRIHHFGRNLAPPTFVQQSTSAWESYALQNYALRLSCRGALVHGKVMHCSAMLQTVPFTLQSVACNVESFHKWNLNISA